MTTNYKALLLGATTLLLSGCLSNITESVEQERVSYQPNQVTVQPTTNQLSTDVYRALIVNGEYQPGQSASSETHINSAGNIVAMEEGLLRISKEVFPTDQYFLREGQVIDSDTLTSWLSRESQLNPEGLNPALPVPETTTVEETTVVADETMTDVEVEETSTGQVNTQPVATPIYLTQIMEKNLMVETEEGYQLSGIVIGLAMNSVYEYVDQDGVVHTQEITVGEVRERGRQMANIIVGRLRNSQDLRSIPIVIGIFRNTPSDDVVGGTYILDGISREGNSVTDWTEIDEYRIALPVRHDDISREQFGYFDDFHNQVLNFFPNLKGITGEALYIDGGLASLNIEIITQFYQQSEITALSQHVTDVAQNVLPDGITIEIKILSDVGIEAYVGRTAGSTQFESHVFN